MTLQELVDRAIFVAYGTNVPSGSDAIIQADLQAEALVPHALDYVSKIVAKDPHKKHLLMQNVTISLTDGQGSFPPGAMTEYLDEGSVRDEYGNVLVRIHHFDDFLEWTYDFRFGYYCMQNGKIWTRAIGSGGLMDSYGLSVDLPVAIAPGDLDGTFSDELEEDVVVMLARLLREGVAILA